jgi:hypothetical protein
MWSQKTVDVVGMFVLAASLIAKANDIRRGAWEDIMM